MKKIMLTFVLVLAVCTNAFCHSPSGIKVDFKEGGIDVEVSHSVSSPASHYVKRVEVKVNGEKAAEKDFTSQTDDIRQKTSFELPALKKGDILEVAAYCSKYGDVKKSVTVE